MVKLTRKGMEGLVSESDEDEEQDELGEEVDGGKLEARRRGLEWDPFGDEEEL
jgi:hypothetical protein